VTPENILRNESGPSVVPPDERTIEPLGRSPEKSIPVPPPARCTKAICRAVSMISSIESRSGSTKHAESIPRRLPAFISVGEFGRNFLVAIRR